MTIELTDIANKFDTHLKDIKEFENAIAEAMYSSYINKGAMVLPVNVERCSRIITYRTFKGKYLRRYER